MLIYTLEKMCQYCRNYFVRGTYTGVITIIDGKIQGVNIPDNTYYTITGSIYNDGLAEAGDYLIDEEPFYGTVSFCAIPKTFINLAVEIDNWETKQKQSPNNVLLSPFTSESFDEYSYSKELGKCGWKSVFAEELRTFMKI